MIRICVHLYFTEKLVMIIGGVDDNDNNAVELVSLDGNPVPDCLSDLNPFPYGGIIWSAGAAMASGMMRQCQDWLITFIIYI